MEKGGCGGKLGGCLGAPVRALARACDSACDLYMRGMSGCARRVPSGSSAGVVGRGFGGAGAPSLRLRVSSDSADDDLARAAAGAKRYPRRVAAEPAAGKKGGADARQRQRRVAAEPAAEDVVNYGNADKKVGAGAALDSAGAPAAVWVPARKKGGAPAMGTIAEDRPCEFGPDGACAALPSLKSTRRGGFGAARAGSNDVFAR